MTITINKAEQLEVVTSASRAPSVHNIQPARWRFTDDGRVWLLEDTRRTLPVADPLGRDNAVSLGAAFEGLHLALSQRGLALSPPVFDDTTLLTPAIFPPLRAIALSQIVPGEEDALAHWVEARHSFRDVFLPVDDQERATLAQSLNALGDIVATSSRAEIHEIAKLNDHYSVVALNQPEYQSELYHWMRFRKSNPAWSRDGLNADGLSLNSVERIAAGMLMYPTVFRVLRHLHLSRFVIAESAKTVSAAAIGVFISDMQELPFHTGRRFYRVWLEVSRMGYALCPMSVLSDSMECAQILRERFGISADKRIINVFRIGKPAFIPNPSPRLPARELIV